MAVKTTLEMLEDCQTAILLAESNQSYTIGDASVQRAKLKDLYAERRRLLSEYNKETGSTPSVFQAYFGNAGE